MPIIQRCLKCQWRFPLDADVCPNPKCSTPVPHGLRNLYFRTKINGRRHGKAAGRISLQDARIKYAAWIGELSAPRRPSFDALTFGRITEEYLNKLKAEGKGYWKSAKLYLRRAVDFIGDLPTVDVTPDKIRRFQTVLREKGASPAYCDRHLEMGCAAWNYSLRGISANPFENVKPYRPDNTLVRELSPKEEADLLLAAKAIGPGGPKHFHEIVLVAIYTGLRMSNILRLRTEEVDFKKDTIRVIQKGNLRLEVYMNVLVRETLVRISPLEGGWFFPNPKTGRPYGQVRKSFAMAKKLAGITRPFRFHDLRHHFAKRMAEVTGGNVLLIKTALGHRDIKTSLKYLPPFEQEVREALERVIVQKG